MQVETVQDFLLKLDMKPCLHLVEISIFSLNLVIVRPTKYMNRADKKQAQFQEIKYLKNPIFQKYFIIVGLLVKYSFFEKDSSNFEHRKMILKVQNLKCSRRLFIILVSLTMTCFSEKMLVSTICIHGFMSNFIKKSSTDSTGAVFIWESKFTIGFGNL